MAKRDIGKIKMSAIDVLTDEPEEQFVKEIIAAMRKIRDPQFEKYELNKEQMLKCLKDISQNLVEKSQICHVPKCTPENLAEAEAKREKSLAELNKNKQLIAETENLTAQIAAKQKQIAALKSETDELIKQEAVLDDVIKNTKTITIDEFKKKEKEIEQKRKEVERIRKTVSDMRETIKKKREDYEKDKSAKEELEKKIKEAEEYSNGAETKLKTMKSEKEKAEMEKERIKRSFDVDMSELLRKERELESKVDDMNTKIRKGETDLAGEGNTIVFAQTLNNSTTKTDDDDLLF
ncbi:hypothetical protein EIN_171530 [Entamoeba invadens IP1]|uniref:Uncharacterized protein n=1 Tax=Entamoeba invadens IP1 TaxID=370355 RepID=A0A0A1U103_ENTIV|nr:hypothetical protein EIN_171530 [Entamoeba invadens IP1]ELP84578.1 hypothetical protein EIN_171530 [Entamoeba invadens IP1]|eukprot:XP_004183924.1 hypothetical protein EIN_171530 [Entamoeba invadens IP1]